jgi:signal transduction histidine kinase
MASIGQLAAGVAHEINNPIGFVSSNLTVLADYQKDVGGLLVACRKLISNLKEQMSENGIPPSIAEQIGHVEERESKADIDFILEDIPALMKESNEGTERIKEIVRDLKDFAHPGEQELKYADINKNLDSTVNVVWNEVKYKARVTKDYAELPLVLCYPQRLNQVFVNLLVNSVQAMKEMGEIRIATRALNGSVEIKIRDTGEGIPEESLSRIFDPFFTTKAVGQGTGLGLNVAHRIIKKHKGTIDVESTVSKGTTFTILIPVVKGIASCVARSFWTRPRPYGLHPKSLSRALMTGVDESGGDTCLQKGMIRGLSFQKGRPIFDEPLARIKPHQL